MHSLVQALSKRVVVGTLLLLLSLVVGPLFAQSMQPAGSFDQWVEARQPLQIDMVRTGVMGGQAVISRNKLYLIGGKRSDGKVSGTLATLLMNGAPDVWKGVGPQPGPVYLHAVADNGQAVYVIGGWDDHIRYSNVWCAQKDQNSDDLGSWIKISDYPTKTVLHNAVATDKYLYVLGGVDVQNQPVDVVRQAPLASTCTPFAANQWQTTEVKLPKALYRAAAVAHNNYIYMTGGNDGVEAQSAIYYTLEGTDGKLTGWQATKSLPERLYDHQVVISGDKLFILGGTDGAHVSNKVYSISIDTTGALKGSWTSEPSLPTSLYRFAAVARPSGDGTIYVIGGFHNDKEQAQVYYSAINPPAPTLTNTPQPTLAPTATSLPLPTSIPTPAPTPGIAMLQLLNQPDTKLDPDGTITYTIQYRNGGYPLENAVIVNVVPIQVDVITESLQNNGIFDGKLSDNGVERQIIWTAHAPLPTDQTGRVSYRVQRPPPTPLPPGLFITKTGPRSAMPGDSIDYTLYITNNGNEAAINLSIFDRVPVHAAITAIGQNGAPEGDMIIWHEPRLEANTTISRTFLVEATQTITNNDYGVIADNGLSATGAISVVTYIGEVAPPRQNEADIIINTGATMTWTYQGQAGAAHSNSAFNPAQKVYLPMTARE